DGREVREAFPADVDPVRGVPVVADDRSARDGWWMLHEDDTERAGASDEHRENDGEDDRAASSGMDAAARTCALLLSRLRHLGDDPSVPDPLERDGDEGIVLLPDVKDGCPVRHFRLFEQTNRFDARAIVIEELDGNALADVRGTDRNSDRYPSSCGAYALWDAPPAASVCSVKK